MSGAVLEIRGLEVVLSGQTILDGVNLSLEPGTIHALLGPNGAGKTTLIRCVVGSLAHRGEIRFRFRGSGRIGYVPQLLDFDHALPYSVADFLTIMMRRRPVFLGRSPSFNDAIRKNLAMTGADHLANRLIGGLSGGELRRVLLAQALVPEPEVLLLDEPASNIDEIGARAFADTLRRLRDETGVAVLMVGHDIETIVRIADRVTGLNRHVTHTGPAESLRDAAVLGRVFGAQAAEFSRSEPAR